MVMVICLSIVIDDLVTWNTWFTIDYVFGITQFFLFSLFIIIIITNVLLFLRSSNNLYLRQPSVVK